MEARPLTDVSLQILTEGSHVVIGVSPFNSYFSEEKLRELATWGYENFSSMHLFIPDVPTTYTLEAVGYSPREATRKAKRQSRYLLNKTLRAVKSLGVSEQVIVTWEQLASNSRYQQLLEEATDAYSSDSDFSRDCREAASWVLHKRLHKRQMTVRSDTAINLDLAARYLLAEMPLFVDSPSIFQQGPSVFAYHSCPLLLENLYRGVYSCRVSDQQGFVVVRAAEERVDDG